MELVDPNYIHDGEVAKEETKEDTSHSTWWFAGKVHNSPDLWWRNTRINFPMLKKCINSQLSKTPKKSINQSRNQLTKPNAGMILWTKVVQAKLEGSHVYVS
jgi:hypothetical protein